MNGFHKWPFLSVQQWGEDPRGTWTLIVESVTTNRNIGGAALLSLKVVSGTFHDWSLLLYGTEHPAQPGDPMHAPGAPPPGQSVLSRVQQVTSQVGPSRNSSSSSPFPSSSSSSSPTLIPSSTRSEIRDPQLRRRFRRPSRRRPTPTPRPSLTTLQRQQWLALMQRHTPKHAQRHHAHSQQQPHLFNKP